MYELSRNRLQTGTASARRCRLALASAVAAGLILLVASGHAGAQHPGRVADAVDRPAVKAQKAGKGTAWLSFTLVGGVVVLAVAASLLFLNTRKPPMKATPVGTRRASNVSAQPPAAPDTIVDPTATCAAPRTHADPELPPGGENPQVVRDDSTLQTAIVSGPPHLPPESLPALPSLANDHLTLPASTGPVSRGATVACGRCRRTVPAELGIPPWCPHCGGDLKMMGAGSATFHAGVPGFESGCIAKGPLLQPPYFMGRLDRTYRVYVLPSKLLFLDAPALDDAGVAERVIRGVSIQAGLIGWVIGSTVVSAIGDRRRARARNRQLMLDVGVAEALVEMAEREATSFFLDVDDLQDVRIDGLTFWQNAFAYRCAGHLRFRCLERGSVAIDLPRPDDVRVAITQLTAVLGERLAVNAAWDRCKERFVPKHQAGVRATSPITSPRS